MASETAARAARLMDAEIRRIERAGIRSGNAAAARLRAEVLRAWLRGGDLYAPLDGWIRRTSAVLADAMAAAYLQGRLRARATARRAERGLNMAQTIGSAMDDFGDRLGLSESAVRQLAEYFSQQATSRVVDAGQMFRSKVADAAANAVQSGLSVRSGASLIRDAMDAAGVTTTNPYLAETLYRTSLQESYAAARWQANQNPATQEILWGYEYAATLDDRTTELCADADGVRRPKGDVFWSRYAPPNHWNCRSQIIEIFFGDDEAAATAVPVLPLPQEGFQANFGDLFANVPLVASFA
jgi:SPP1 gp7 family putative phage head morphogenesis protein